MDSAGVSAPLSLLRCQSLSLDLTDACSWGQANFSHMAANNPHAGAKHSENYKGLYGWTGWGGSLCLVDVERKATFMYTMTGQQ